MNWNAARASTWLKRFADDVGGDAYKMGGDDVLYCVAGAAYYAMIHGVGYNTKDEFKNFVTKHMGLDQDFLEDAIQEIEK
jgi:hypothetical protein